MQALACSRSSRRRSPYRHRLAGHERLRAGGRHPRHADAARPLLIALTGNGQAEDFDRSRDAGFDHHFVKPAEISRPSRPRSTGLPEDKVEERRTRVGAHGASPLRRTGPRRTRRPRARSAVGGPTLWGRAPATKPVFAGNTEMARRMRELDWSKTPLGPSRQWPQSLRTSVSTCLDCAFPIVLWWGPELAILYNDEYAPILGPPSIRRALGRARREGLGGDLGRDRADAVAGHGARRSRRARAISCCTSIATVTSKKRIFRFPTARSTTRAARSAASSAPSSRRPRRSSASGACARCATSPRKCKGAESETAAYEAAAEVLAANPQRRAVRADLSRRRRRGRPRSTPPRGIEAGASPAAPRAVTLGRRRRPLVAWRRRAHRAGRRR